jgi:hypothetical protein
MPRNNLHSFTLTSQASKIIRREAKHRYGSKFASKAIIWYDRVGIRIPAYQDKLLKELVEDNENLREVLRLVCLERDELKKSQSFISKMRKKWSK